MALARVLHAITALLAVGILSAGAVAQARYSAVPYAITNAHELTLTMAFGDQQILRVHGGAADEMGVLLVGFYTRDGQFVVVPHISFPFAFDANGVYQVPVNLAGLPDGAVLFLQAVAIKPGCEELSCLMTSHGLRLSIADTFG